ncbi:hypothetical protein C1O66_10550 [Paucibacter aquatile]|uniref:Integrase n=2 Tax=Kinneretia aquatilis TaxID=2070761 RepID=A0A2N8KWU3_9BURK|nr:hypothetical protein C1O66_10550 [Paucibacter aquatile]
MGELEMLLRTPNRTPETLQSYRRVMRTLENHLARRLAVGDLRHLDDRNLQLAITWHDLRPFISASTDRQYKAALMQHLREHPSEEDIDRVVMELLDPEQGISEIEHDDRLAEQRKRNLMERRGSQQRARYVSPEDWHTLITALCASSSQVGKLAAVWLASTRATGLRPCEWATARRQGVTLIVQNAKATNGRSHGPTREIFVGGLDPMQLRIIDSLLDVMAMLPEGAFVDLYNRVRDLVADVGRASLTKRSTYPTLYSARHLFAAEAKRELTRIEVAALMGHRSIASAAQNYLEGRYAQGGGALKVRASDRDMDTVRRANGSDPDLKH